SGLGISTALKFRGICRARVTYFVPMVMTQELVYTYNIYKEKLMTSSKIFYNNTTQAVRLPKDVAFPLEVTEVDIFIQGETRVIAPKGQSLVAWMQTGPHFTSDFMVDRDQPPMPEDEEGIFE
ncbi:MAG: type II toxin-antitoxin system VapB family antitoxin, partial [Aurantimicrobium sp.]